MPGRVNKRGRNAQGAVFHGIGNQSLHLLQFSGSGSAVIVADHGFAHLGSAYVSPNVERRALFFQALEIAVKCYPVDRQLVLLQSWLKWGEGLIVLRSDGSAFARDFCGNALGQLADSAIRSEEHTSE